jgi:hypothetical protein
MTLDEVEELPVGTIVANDGHAWIKWSAAPAEKGEWDCTNCGTYSNAEISTFLREQTLAEVTGPTHLVRIGSASAATS